MSSTESNPPSGEIRKRSLIFLTHAVYLLKAHTLAPAPFPGGSEAPSPGAGVGGAQTLTRLLRDIHFGNGHFQVLAPLGKLLPLGLQVLAGGAPRGIAGGSTSLSLAGTARSPAASERAAETSPPPPPPQSGSPSDPLPTHNSTIHSPCSSSRHMPSDSTFTALRFPSAAAPAASARHSRARSRPPAAILPRRTAGASAFPRRPGRVPLRTSLLAPPPRPALAHAPLAPPAAPRVRRKEGSACRLFGRGREVEGAGSGCAAAYRASSCGGA